MQKPVVICLAHMVDENVFHINLVKQRKQTDSGKCLNFGACITFLLFDGEPVML